MVECNAVTCLLYFKIIRECIWSVRFFDLNHKLLCPDFDGNGNLSIGIKTLTLSIVLNFSSEKILEEQSTVMPFHSYIHHTGNSKGKNIKKYPIISSVFHFRVFRFRVCDSICIKIILCDMISIQHLLMASENYCCLLTVLLRGTTLRQSWTKAKNRRNHIIVVHTSLNL